MYDAMLNALTSDPFCSEAVFDGQTDIAVAKRVFKGVLNDHPLLFWADPSLATTFDGHETRVRFKANSLYDSRCEISERLESACDSVRDAICSDAADDYSISLAVHDHLASSVEYEDMGEMGHCAAGPLLEGKGVCEGISEAYSLLMCSMGVKCTKIDGHFYDSDVGHSWNIAYIDGRPYHTDVTSDLSGQHRFLNCSDDLMCLTHRFSRFVRCDSLEANPYFRNGAMFGTVEDSDRYLKEKMDGNGIDAEFLVLEGSSAEHYFDVLGPALPGSRLTITTSSDGRGFLLRSEAGRRPSGRLIDLMLGKRR